MNTTEEVIAIDLEDLDSEKIMISPVMTKKWSYKHKETGEMCTGSYPYVLIYYEKQKQGLFVTFNDIRTNNGIQTSAKYSSLFLSCNLTEEQSAMAKKKIDDRVAELLCEVRQQFLKGHSNLGKIKQPSDVSFLMRPFVQDGQLKGDGSEDKYNDQITTTVPSKKVNKQVVVNEDVCTIEDTNGKPYAWAAIGGQSLSSLTLGIVSVKMDEVIKYTTEARIIVPTETSRAKVTTKRKLEQAKELKENQAKKKQTVAKPGKPQMQSKTKPAVSAFNSKLKTPVDETPEEAQEPGSDGDQPVDGSEE
jgi:hypothetical protein